MSAKSQEPKRRPNATEYGFGEPVARGKSEKQGGNIRILRIYYAFMRKTGTTPCSFPTIQSDVPLRTYFNPTAGGS